MVKEMFPQPASACAKYDPDYLFPTSGAAIMVRDAQGSKDGWFWGWYGWPGEGWEPDWPASASNGPPNMGFGQYCVNCHGSAHDLTFAEERNLQGHPGQPEVFLSQDFFANQYLGGAAPKTAGKAKAPIAATAPDDLADDIHAVRAHMEKKPVPHGQPRIKPLDDLLAFVTRADRFGAVPEHGFIMPSQTYDNVWMPAAGPSPESQYLTSDQCAGCHDAGSTGLQFDMTMPDPQSDKLLNLSPKWPAKPRHFIPIRLIWCKPPALAAMAFWGKGSFKLIMLPQMPTIAGCLTAILLMRCLIRRGTRRRPMHPMARWHAMVFRAWPAIKWCWAKKRPRNTPMIRKMPVCCNVRHS
jgi:cytochrome c553